MDATATNSNAPSHANVMQPEITPHVLVIVYVARPLKATAKMCFAKPNIYQCVLRNVVAQCF